MERLHSLILFAILALAVDARLDPFGDKQAPTKADDNNSCDPGAPLILTPYIRRNQIALARNLSRVHLSGVDFGPQGYSGYLTVNDSDASQMFFWYFESDDRSKPLLVWLQGGPGASSLYGLFAENGPYRVDSHLNVHSANYSWTQLANVLYIDNPIGAGFSFTDTVEGYSTNELEVGWNLYRFIEQFYVLFPEMRHNELYLSGESYAGKYLPAFAHRIQVENSSRIPLAGVAMGDAWTDPVNMIAAYSQMMFDMGLADERQRDLVADWMGGVQKLVRMGWLIEAVKSYLPFMFGDGQHASYFYNVTGSTDIYNILRSRDPDQFYYYYYFTQCSVRRAIHVGHTHFGSRGQVFRSLAADFMSSIRQWLPALFDSYRFLIYNGQLDFCVGTTLTERMLGALDRWSYRNEFEAANKTIWRVRRDDTEVAGFVRALPSRGFYQAVVRGAGHMVPRDQPRRAFDMMRRFLERILF